MWSDLNVKHFNGRLQPVPIKLTRSRRTYGYFNGKSNGESSIHISAALCTTDQLMLDTMAHEMIHQSLYAVGADGWELHGDAFQILHCTIFGHAYVEPD